MRDQFAAVIVLKDTLHKKIADELFIAKKGGEAFNRKNLYF